MRKLLEVSLKNIESKIPPIFEIIRILDLNFPTEEIYNESGSLTAAKKLPFSNSTTLEKKVLEGI